MHGRIKNLASMMSDFCFFFFWPIGQDQNSNVLFALYVF